MSEDIFKKKNKVKIIWKTSVVKNVKTFNDY